MTIAGTSAQQIVVTQPSNESTEKVRSLAEALGLDVKEYKNQATILSKAVLNGMVEAEAKSSITALSTTNNVTKKAYEIGDRAPFIEIRPPIARVPNEVPMYAEMVDSNTRTCVFVAEDGTIIQALKLSPNPNSIIVNSSKMINRYNTMTRWVEEHWGDEIDMITISGSSFSLMAFQPAVGLSVVNRNNTAAYLYLKELIKFYRTNGCLFQDNSYERAVSNKTELSDDDAVYRFLKDNPSFCHSHPMRGMIKERVLIRITLDYVSFLGYFENFDLIEDSASPYRFTYNITFKSERTKLIVGV
jgi:hypothetical protein